MGSVGSNSVESVSDFINRAIDNNTKIFVKADDIQAITGTKSDVLKKIKDWETKTKAHLYFAGFAFLGDTVNIQAEFTKDSAKRALDWRERNRGGK